MLDRLMRACILAAGIVIPGSTLGSCAAPDPVPSAVRKRASLIDVVNTTMRHLRDENAVQGRLRAEDYLNDQAGMQEHPAIRYLFGLVLGANADLVNGKFKQSSAQFETLINQFETDYTVIERIRQFIPQELYLMPAYQEGKRKLKASVWMSPKEIYAVYGFWCLFDGNYDEAASAFREGKKYYTAPNDQARIMKFAAQIEMTATVWLSRMNDKGYIVWDEISGLRRVRDELDPTYKLRETLESLPK